MKVKLSHLFTLEKLKTMSIHREGRSLLFWLLIILSAGNYALYYYLPGQELLLNLVLLVSVIFYLIILQFFRNPFVPVRQDEGMIYAPADGKVVVIEETVEDEYLKEKRKQISIFIPFRSINSSLGRNTLSTAFFPIL